MNIGKLPRAVAFLGTAFALLWVTVRPLAAETIVIGSKDFPESRLLAEIMAQLIEEETDLEVVHRENLGTANVFAGLLAGEIDLYPEYTGTGWSVHLKREDAVESALHAYIIVRREFRQRFDLEWLEPFGFNNTYAMALDSDVAERLGVSRVSDLKQHEDEIRVGLSHEFLKRPDGYPGLAEAYGLEFDNLNGMNHGLAYQALADHEIDMVDAYSTDGKLLKYDVKILEDDRKFFPPYDAAPLIRRDTLARHPELRRVLSRLAFTLDDDSMRELNYIVEVEKGEFDAVARKFLVENGLLEEAELDPLGTTAQGLFARIFSAEMFGHLKRHIFLTGIAVLLASLFAIPIGILLTRSDRSVGPALGTAGVIQTVPSLALLAFMIPLLGLGPIPAIAALFLYALLPILRNTYTGISEVDPELVDAARGMGLRDSEILWHVQLPLSWRTIMAGVRTSTVISIGVATLAAFIGAGGLGDPIVTGLQLNDMEIVLSGAIPAAVLAVVVDWLLGRLEHRLVPRGLRTNGE